VIRHQLGNRRDRLRAAAGQLPRPLDLLSLARQRLDLAATELNASLRHLGQGKRLAFERSAGKLTPRVMVQRAEMLSRQLAELSRREASGMARLLEQKRAAYATRAATLTPTALVADLRHANARLAPCAERLRPALRRLVVQRGNDLTALGKLLESYSYKGVLERGFALVVDDQGHIVRSKAAVRPGQLLAIEVADGQFGAAVSGAPVSRKRPRPPKDDGGQESLF